MLTATVASVFIKEHTDDNNEEFKKGHADLNEQLSVMGGRLTDVERQLGATPDDRAEAGTAAEPETATTGSVAEPPSSSIALHASFATQSCERCSQPLASCQAGTWNTPATGYGGPLWSE